MIQQLCCTGGGLGKMMSGAEWMLAMNRGQAVQQKSPRAVLVLCRAVVFEAGLFVCSDSIAALAERRSLWWRCAGVSRG